jgi:hypothetical protein
MPEDKLDDKWFQSQFDSAMTNSGHELVSLELQNLSNTQLITYGCRGSCTDAEFELASKLETALFYIEIMRGQLEDYSENEKIIDPNTGHSIDMRIVAEFLE